MFSYQLGLRIIRKESEEKRKQVMALRSKMASSEQLQLGKDNL